MAEIESKKALLSVKELVRDAAAEDLLKAQAEVTRLRGLLEDGLPLPGEEV